MGIHLAGGAGLTTAIGLAVASVDRGPFRVPCFDVFEVALASDRTYANPFLDVTVTVEFTAPSGKALRAYGFHDGADTWRVRVAPDEVGTWTYATSASDPGNAGLHARHGAFQCVPSANKGFIRPDVAHPYYFSYSDGAPWFALGDTCTVTTPALSDANRKAYLDARAGKPFNFLRILSSLTFNAWTGEPWSDAILAEDGFPWGGTPQAPDYDRLNPRYFQRFERILGELKASGIHAEIVVYNLYERPFKEPETWTPAREALWGRYLVSRLAADTTVFLWTVAQEYERYPEGRYHYDPGDDEWARRMARLIRDADPHRHPVTVHPWGWLPGDGPHGTSIHKGIMGQRFGGADEIDVISHQECSYASAWQVADPAPPHWDGPAEGVDQAVWADRKYGKPVVNTEYGYEWLKDAPPRGQMHSTDKCRRAAWRLFTAGAAGLSAGFLGTMLSMDLADTYYSNKRNLIPFRVADMGHAAQLGHLCEFVTKETAFQEMIPAQGFVNAPNLCLADPGKEYVVYAPNGGEVTLDLAAAPGAFRLRWLDPRTGAYRGEMTVTGGAKRAVSAPDAEDWVLHVKAG